MTELKQENGRRKITVQQFHDELRAQGVSDRAYFAFVCPCCKTVQCGQDLINAGAGKTFDDVEQYLAFSCVGRFTGAGDPRKKPDGRPCNWTLGGLFQIHELEIVVDDGPPMPRFELASKAEAQLHEARLKAKARAA